MAKKKSNWLSPKKQKELEKKLAKKKKQKKAIIASLSVLALVGVVFMIYGIVMACRPYYADIEIEGYGVITIELHRDEAPITVDQFIELANSGYYNGLTINRILDDKIQGGGGTSRADKVSTIKGEFSANGVENNVPHVRGKISMIREMANGNSAEKSTFDTAKGEFFILRKDCIDLDGYFAAFGTVIQGMEIVDEICEKVSTIPGSEGLVADENQPVIKSITIRRGE